MDVPMIYVQTSSGYQCWYQCDMDYSSGCLGEYNHCEGENIETYLISFYLFIYVN